MKILLFGKNGQVGWELNRTLLPLGEVVALGRDDADFSNPESLRKIIREIEPDVIVNAAAYTTVDKAEEEEDLALVINGEAPKVIAEEASKINALLVHYSTDYVFDGTKLSPYIETDDPHPINAYGRTKLAGERSIELSGCKFIIFRISWVYGVRGKNFLRTMIKLMRDRDQIGVVDDQVGTPTWSRYIAETTASVVMQTQIESKKQFVSDTYHLPASGKATWHGFANEIAKVAKELMGESWLTIENIKPISSSEYRVPAKRPVNSVMSGNRLTQKYNVIMPGWENCLELAMQELCIHENQLKSQQGDNF